MRDILRWVLHWLSAAPAAVSTGKIDVAVGDAAVYSVTVSDAAVYYVTVSDRSRDE